MPAPTANTNASKWTREKTNHVLDQIEIIAADDHIFTLTQALLKLKYYKQLWSYLKKTWELDADIMDRIYYIEQIFINKLEEAALFKKLNPSACFFILKHNYGYNTKGENELPSHLRADLEEPTDEPRSGSKTTAQPPQKPSVSVAKSIIQPPATGFTSINKDMYGTGQRQNDRLITANPYSHRPTKPLLK